MTGFTFRKKLTSVFCAKLDINIEFKDISGRWERREMRIEFWFESLKERDHSEYICADGRIILKWILGNRVRGYGLNPCSSG
jgi:hypothetical protein